MSKIKILAISGSLRRGSLNTRLIKAAVREAPGNVTIEIADIADIPLYNGDVEANAIPAPVEALAEKLREADALLIATPEYNFSIPGVLKNAIDWLSRVKPQPFVGKATAVMGASPSPVGTARAQYHLRQALLGANAQVMNRPEVIVSRADKAIAEDGTIADDATRGFVASLVAALADTVKT